MQLTQIRELYFGELLLISYIRTITSIRLYGDEPIRHIGKVPAAGSLSLDRIRLEDEVEQDEAENN